jgi:branched-chain amino acid transport system permease protein
MELVHVIIQGVLLGGLYALFAAGLSLIFGVMRLVNIAHGDLIVVAAYMAYFTMQALGVGPFTSLLVHRHLRLRAAARTIELRAG